MDYKILCQLKGEELEITSEKIKFHFGYNETEKQIQYH